MDKNSWPLFLMVALVAVFSLRNWITAKKQKTIRVPTENEGNAWEKDGCYHAVGSRISSDNLTINTEKVIHRAGNEAIQLIEQRFGVDMSKNPPCQSATKIIPWNTVQFKVFTYVIIRKDDLNST